MDTPSRTIDAMQRNAVLGGMSEEILAALIQRAQVLDLPAGAILIRQGEDCDGAYLIVSGSLEVSLETAMGDVPMAILGPQQIVGEIAVFTDLPRTATVRTLEDAQVLRIERTDLANVIINNPSAAFGIIRTLSRRVNALNRPLALLTLAAQELERANTDSIALANLLDEHADDSPFAASFRKIIGEMKHKNAQRSEMEFAARLQRSILPRALDFGPGSPFQAAAFMRPAKDVGGDFYDFFHTSDGRVILVVADVSGKGVPASLFMAVSQTLVRAIVQSASTIEAAISTVNAQLEARNDEGLFVTVFLAEITPSTGKLRYINAGHCDGYIRRADGHMVPLSQTGPAVALISNKTFVASEAPFAPGDLLFITSDGITEAFNPAEDLFGEDRLIDAIKALPSSDPVNAIEAVNTLVTHFADGCEQSDDITCLALLYHPRD